MLEAIGRGFEEETLLKSKEKPGTLSVVSTFALRIGVGRMGPQVRARDRFESTRYRNMASRSTNLTVLAKVRGSSQK